MGEAMILASVGYAVTGTTWSCAGARRGIEAPFEDNVVPGAGAAARDCRAQASRRTEVAEGHIETSCTMA
jgi:hypothetical protein